jgi:hypothetical protein
MHLHTLEGRPDPQTIPDWSQRVALDDRHVAYAPGYGSDTYFEALIWRFVLQGSEAWAGRLVVPPDGVENVRVYFHIPAMSIKTKLATTD